MNLIDMHVHSTASDGVFNPSKLVEYAIRKGLSGIAITDHDTVDGIREAVEAANHYNNFIIIPGIELSSEHENEEVHILGYGIDYKAKFLQEILRDLKNERDHRARKIIRKLNDLGLNITYEAILRITMDGVIGRPHIARALIESGYVRDMEGAFKKYLNSGSPAYVPRQKLTPTDAIGIIKRAGGISVVAHPGLLKSISLVDSLIEKGIDGIEVYHPEHSIEESSKYLAIAKAHNLLVTAGSDFHYPPEHKAHGSDLGSTTISLKHIQKLLQR